MISTNSQPQAPTHKQKKIKRKHKMRKLNRSHTFSDVSDNEISEPKYRSNNTTMNSTDTALSECDITTNKSFSPIDLTLKNTAPYFDNENCCPVSIEHEKMQNNDLNQSLSNLYLSGNCKQLLSPPKLKTVMQNPWTAGGFWHSSYPCGSTPPAESSDSRSSSQSSGFISQTQEKQCFNSLPVSRANSCHSAEDKASVLSEPMFVSEPKIGGNPKMKNTFFPNLRTGQTLYIQAGGPVVSKAFFRGTWSGSAANISGGKDSAFGKRGLFKNPEFRHGNRSNFGFNEM